MRKILKTTVKNLNFILSEIWSHLRIMSRRMTLSDFF